MDRSLEHAMRRPSGAASPDAPAGAFVLLDGEEHYRISGHQRLEPFLVNLASDTDLWMFITSSGGLTAGRVSAEGSLFPYLTSDRLADAHHHTGPTTLMRLETAEGAERWWEPLSAVGPERPGIERNLYKNSSGSRILFEEIERDLGLAFRYRWCGNDEFGWVRTATLENRGRAPIRVSLLDGLRNILPWGAPLVLYQQASNLVDAYKKSEADPATGLGIFSLTAGITDRPEALEVLRANTVWCCGLERFRVHLSREAIDAFRRGRSGPGETLLTGRRGNYLVSSDFDLGPGQTVRWHLVADAGLDHVRVAELRRTLLAGEKPAARVEASLRRANESLRRIVASADGLQLSGRPESGWHHFANALFNSMRGGVFSRNHDVPVADFAGFLRTRNRAVADRQASRLAAWPAALPVQELRRLAGRTGDPDFARLSHEYLPLYFGRRHGDPSRPWNRFEIRVRDRNGERVLHHEGNWRDIFQNWEALGTAFPRFLPSMVARFVNASTVDGFNPYRITRDGVDWEVPSPGEPWSHIGYWGDHQIVYLLRLLEALERYEPEALPAMLDAEIFSYADVPYRIKPYEDLLRDPRATIVYDTDQAARIEERVARLGTDGRLLADREGRVRHVNLLEKLLVPALSKLSNLIPGAGIWMNTQRPEWNDANNALGGGSVSVVTLCHLRRYLDFLGERLLAAAGRELAVSGEVVAWFDRLAEILAAQPEMLDAAHRDPRVRKERMDALGRAFSEYRATVYARGLSGSRALAIDRVAAFCRAALEWVDRSIAANRREDGLYHTYNQLEFSADGRAVSVAHLQEMLEGQVALLSSGAVGPAEGLAILERLFASALYRPDQRSFMLYPEREPPGFLDKNAIPDDRIAAIPLLRDLLAAGERSLLARDALGVARFHGDLRSVRDLAAVLDALSAEAVWAEAVARDRASVLDLFESVFAHRSYPGRSAAMYGYEGIGCIYWHMVAKLLLAAQETLVRAEREGASPELRHGLTEMYLRIQAGIGYRKSVAEYGAFPTDPYSHTPRWGGARQPGMTGQVKEEILTRLGELGVRVEAGAIRFRPLPLLDDEFLAAPCDWRCFDVEGAARTFALPAGAIGFTFCQVPVIYERAGGEPRIRVVFADGSVREESGTRIEAELAARIFDRDGSVDHVRVALPSHTPREDLRPPSAGWERLAAGPDRRMD